MDKKPRKFATDMEALKYSEEDLESPFPEHRILQLGTGWYIVAPNQYDETQSMILCEDDAFRGPFEVKPVLK